MTSDEKEKRDGILTLFYPILQVSVLPFGKNAFFYSIIIVWFFRINQSLDFYYFFSFLRT